jgi:AraC family transcriptional regulator
MQKQSLFLETLEEKRLPVELIQKEGVLQLDIKPPQFKSSHLGWKCIQAGYYELPAIETPELSCSHHLIGIFVGTSAGFERLADNKVDAARITRGDIICDPAGMKRIIRLLDPSKFIHLYLDPALIGHLAREHIDPDRVEILPQMKLRDPFIEQLGLNSIAAASNTIEDSLYTEAAATMLGAHMLRYYSSHSITWKDHNRGLGKSQLQVAIEYIDAHLDEELSIDTLAQLVEMNSFYFMRFFKRSMGISARAYIIRQRLERAKHLLKFSNLSLVEIAFSTGFGSQSRFSTVFRQHFQVSPKVYRSQQ